jgi:hypothetical protein
MSSATPIEEAESWVPVWVWRSLVGGAVSCGDDFYAARERPGSTAYR